MTSVVEIFQNNLPAKTKKTPSGWTSFNAPCCHHRGENHDTRQRGGVRYNQGFVFNCFNCGFTASWKPGRPVSNKLKSLMKWLGASDDDINKMIFEAMRTEAQDSQTPINEPTLQFARKDLPKHTMSLQDWADLIEGEIEEKIGREFVEVLRYLMDRGYDNPFEHNFMWSPEPGYIDRVIIPFCFQGQTVGWTARKITQGNPKYLSDQHPNFVFNLDSVRDQQQYLFVVEGPFDALAVNGVALLHNDISDQQARLINRLGKTVIVIPDQDSAGERVIDRAIELDWQVAFPNWDPDVKDCADAVKKYGSLFVTVDAINSSVAGPIRINLLRRKRKTAQLMT
jgi:hypothetical protein